MADVQVDGPCPKCKTLGMPAVVFLTGDMQTLAAFSPFRDAEGRTHHHDGNTHRKSYRCSNEHRWSEIVPPAQCWCGWPDNQEDD